MKKILICSSIFISFMANADVSISNLNENPEAANNMRGVRILNNVQTSNNDQGNNSGTSKSENEELTPLHENTRANTQNQGVQASNSSQPSTLTNNSTSGFGLPGGMITVNPTSISPNGSKTGYQAPVPKSYLDMENQNRSAGQTPPTPLTIKPMTLQQWNRTTINETTTQGQQIERERYQEFRRGR